MQTPLQRRAASWAAALCLGLVMGLGLGLSTRAHAFDVQGHRGARGLAPENTLPAFERALQIRRLAATLHGEALVLETDAPDIAPAWRHPARNEPAELARIAEVLAGLRGESVAQVAQRTSANARRVLPRLAALERPADPCDLAPRPSG